MELSCYGILSEETMEKLPVFMWTVPERKWARFGTALHSVRSHVARELGVADFHRDGAIATVVDFQ
jgi:hypothetical protein